MVASAEVVVVVPQAPYTATALYPYRQRWGSVYDMGLAITHGDTAYIIYLAYDWGIPVPPDIVSVLFKLGHTSTLCVLVERDIVMPTIADLQAVNDLLADDFQGDIESMINCADILERCIVCPRQKPKPTRTYCASLKHIPQLHNCACDACEDRRFACI